jgi:PhnB protein
VSIWFAAKYKRAGLKNQFIPESSGKETPDLSSPDGERLLSSAEDFTRMHTLTVKSHIPPGFPAVTPFITVEDPGQFAEFARSAFGAEELREQRGTTDDGMVMHVALRIEGCIIEGGRASGHWKAMPTALHLYVRDVDSAYARALKAGGVSLHEVREMDYDERAAAVQDPFGNHWYIATYTGGREKKR